MSSSRTPDARYLNESERTHFFHLVHMLGFSRTVALAAVSVATTNEPFVRNARWLMHRGLTDPKLSRVMIQDELKELRPDLSTDELDTEGTPIEEQTAIYKKGQPTKDTAIAAQLMDNCRVGMIWATYSNVLFCCVSCVFVLLSAAHPRD
jgi:hypothetical protein